MGVNPETLTVHFKASAWKTESMVTPVFATPILTINWLVESIRRLNGILFPRLDEFRA
jgi:hypothetical protein